MKTFDVIVAGLGGMGSSAAFHLARRGVRVLGIDRLPLAHDRGSSHGHTRLIRQAYFEHPDYVPLLKRSYALWDELERLHGRRLFAKTGLLLAGPAAGEVLPGAARSAREHGLAVELLHPTEAVTRWPAFQIPPAWSVLHEPEAGALFVEDCVRAHAEAARAAGAEFAIGPIVAGFRADGRDIVVETDRDRFVGRRLVLCPGPWAGGLLQLPAIPLRVLRKSLFWHLPRGDMTTVAEGTMPCFGFETPHGFFYGTPAFDARGIKIANHSGGRLVEDPLAVDRAVDTEEQSAIDRFIDGSLPVASHARADHATCLYTMSPDSHFLLGLHPRHPAVALAAGFSGHGFKFASVVGEALADLALDGGTTLPIGFLRPERFLPSTQ